MNRLVLKIVAVAALLACVYFLLGGSLEMASLVVGIGTMGVASVLDDKIAALKTELTRNTQLKNSIVALIKSIPDMIAKAKADALALGATDAQLASFDEISTTLAANDGELADAVIAGTPAGGG